MYLCLFADHGHDLRHLLREASASDAQLTGAIAEIWAGRSDRYSEQRSRSIVQVAGAERRVEMHYIGG
jgi:cyclic pyranopterin phosphate synthase